MKTPLLQLIPQNRQEWRTWLEKNHDSGQIVQVVLLKKHAQVAGISYTDAVAEALCFGWIDSTARTYDTDRFIQTFGARKAKSPWSGINKKKSQELIDAQLMTAPGFASIAAAKANGYWNILDDVEKLLIPADLQAAFKKSPKAADFYEQLSNAEKRMILYWLITAQRETTRSKRIADLVTGAAKGLKPAILPQK
ncbi:uncharacterized protein YdeI (YjbR/CyaY-like superfamily) [Chitinophaga skermanii]|uniref:Uncharacterized protein YdeI (YjbR/CyaY-like superfamily) n=1 Tax=Chitinophaga skermanii TaxID=331697 RepID=A0A327QY42_9BACT|nr:YdeI/OmpD-associated family protein [Chitinophaga skermanii]RAJ08668.1 uncharacterized protein YdeI (YjbR/CyaY-like superfamily) [Chitinophaga skermanii]